MATTSAQQHLQDIIKLINSGNASISKPYTYTEGEGTYGAYDILSNGKVALTAGYLPAGADTQISQIPGTNNYQITVGTGNKNTLARLTVEADPNTGIFKPVTSSKQLTTVQTGQSGGTFLDSVVENTLGKVNEWIDGDPVKAAIIFASLAAGVPPLEGGSAAATTEAAAATTGEAAATTAGTTAAENAAVDQALIDLSASVSPEIAATDLTASEALSGVDLGGVGASPNTMLGEGQYLEAVPAATPSVSQITTDIAADNIDAGGGWSPATGATEAELAQAKAAMASNGWTLKQALDAVRAGLLVNSITGDPLGLGDSGGGGGATVPTGFAQVPIPTEWKSPEYSYTPVQNVTFEDLFPGVSLQGTQWQGLQNVQPSMSFNDIFASGMQQTPMGSPVDINQIVSAIVGQNAKI